MIIRKLTDDDNAKLAIIIRNALAEFKAVKPGTVYFDETTDNLSELFKTKRSGYFVIDIDGEVAGGGGFYPTVELPENVCELVKMYIAKKHRGKGWGNILLQKCIDEAKKQGYHKMYLESMPELVNAIALYNKNGFNHIPGPLGNSGHSGCDVWMMRDL